MCKRTLPSPREWGIGDTLEIRVADAEQGFGRAACLSGYDRACKLVTGRVAQLRQLSSC